MALQASHVLPRCHPSNNKINEARPLSHRSCHFQHVLSDGGRCGSLNSTKSPAKAHRHMGQSGRARVIGEASSPSFVAEVLDGWNDEYDGVVIDPSGLPSDASAFCSSLKTSLSRWRSKGKKGIWLKIPEKYADYLPIAIEEGFVFHHAEPGYAMLTHWIPKGLCMLPSGPSHVIGVAAFVINHRNQVLVVKEKYPNRTFHDWKLPTGYVNQSEDLFSGVVREVKEETGIDTEFLNIVAFRHAHMVAFNKSDLMFVCVLKPLSYDILMDEKEITAAQWMDLGELMTRPLYSEDAMARQIIDACASATVGFTPRHLLSNLDGGKHSYLYYHHISSN